MVDSTHTDSAGSPFFILSLDGGGSKGIYTIGVLKELEQFLGEPLHRRFDLVFGTSTGSIIGALVALGTPAAEIERIYLDMIPKIMSKKLSFLRTRALRKQATAVFGELRFDAFLTNVGIVATNAVAARPMIFKTSVDQAYSLQASFRPGFGCTIAEAVIASSAAIPFFRPTTLNTANQGEALLLDGGFVANNPTLMAVADALGGKKVPIADLRVLSVGVGHYKEPKRNWYHQVLYYLWPFRIIQTMFPSSANTSEIIRRILFSELACVRIDGSYPDAQYATDMLESDPRTLKRLAVLGRESFGNQEKEVAALFGKGER